VVGVIKEQARVCCIYYQHLLPLSGQKDAPILLQLFKTKVTPIEISLCVKSNSIIKVPKFVLSLLSNG
jgi:hypothetical protein